MFLLTKHIINGNSRNLCQTWHRCQWLAIRVLCH